jgi:hypothetical protein
VTEHGKNWLKLADKVNAVYGKDFVTPYSDAGYGVDKSNSFWYTGIRKGKII